MTKIEWRLHAVLVAAHLMPAYSPAIDTGVATLMFREWSGNWRFGLLVGLPVAAFVLCCLVAPIALWFKVRAARFAAVTVYIVYLLIGPVLDAPTVGALLILDGLALVDLAVHSLRWGWRNFRLA